MTQLNVFPVREGTKAPAIKNWQERSRPIWDWLDPQQENPQWLGHTRWGAPAGALNGWWVLDVDPRHGGDESLRELEAKYGPLPQPLTIVRTPSGGYHYYWTWVDGCERLTNTAGKLGPGLDIRAEGGMVLVPPTPGYEVMSTCGNQPAPLWLMALLMPAPKVKATAGSDADGEAPIRRPRDHFARALQAAIDEIKAAPEGSRDATMNRNAYGVGRLIGPAEQPRDSVVEVLVDAAIAAGYDPAKALDCCNRAVDAGMQNPRTVAAANVPAVAADHTGTTGDQTVQPEVAAQRLVDAGGNIALRSCPPKPGPQPADLTSAAGRLWTQKNNEYQSWQRDLRDVLRARLVVIEYDQTRVLHERVGLRRVMVLGTADKQAGHIIAIGRRHGFLVPAGTASSLAEEFLRLDADLVVREHPSMWDRGDGLFRWDAPNADAGAGLPCPTWETILDRLSDPDAFLAHVWSIFEPRYEGRQVLWLQGAGNDGKSIAMNALIRGTGLQAASLSDTDLLGGNQFLYSSLWDKPLVLVNESKNVNVLMTGTIHKLTGRDLVSVEYKHGQRFAAQFQGVVFVTSNGLPEIEKTASNLTRLTVVTIKPLKQFIPGLVAKLVAEVPALLFRARNAYALRCKDHFRIDLNDAAQAAVSAATGFEDEMHATVLHAAGIRLDPEGFLSRKDVMRQVIATGAKLDANRTASFYRWLVEQPGVVDCKREGARGFKGIRL